ncbi:MAG: polysaccharide biosynthesis/export family protein [Verrucomicrobiota bacterium]|nr:polysaccharide biosynthesis/export family protein [Verrucomicrobiota bacterium]
MKNKVLLLFISFFSMFVFAEEKFPNADSLRPGDILLIQVFQHPELELRVNVQTDYYINYPFCDKIFVMNKTLDNISKIIEEKLKQKNYEKVQVSIFVEEFSKRYVYVTGEVKKPQGIEVKPGLHSSARQAIATGEGFTEKADKNKIFVRRRFKNKTKIYPLKIMDTMLKKENLDDFILIPEDTIIVPSTKPVSVLGQVKKPAIFYIQTNPMTISQAIAIAGGFDKLADEDEVLLIRNKKITRINLKNLFKTNGDIKENVQILPGDIIFVTESKW